MNDITAVIICCTAALVSVGLLITAWSLKNAADDVSNRIARDLRDVADTRETIKNYVQGMRNAAEMIERCTKGPEPKPTKKEPRR